MGFDPRLAAGLVGPVGVMLPSDAPSSSLTGPNPGDGNCKLAGLDATGETAPNPPLFGSDFHPFSSGVFA